jgi:hypothetical protein
VCKHFGTFGIGMLEWEQDLIQHQTLNGGIYGRFVVKIIFH